MIFPWQQDQWRQLHLSRQANRLPHALLFKGSEGTGKSDFADHFARALLCAQNTPDGHACDHCHSCRLVSGKSHPDILRITPEKEGGAIKVDQIRDVTEYINQSSLHCGYRIVIIQPANAMNASAANALLKTLEEPSGGAIIILISDQSTRLPATILSRCQSIYFPCPSHETAHAWVLQQKFKSDTDGDILLKLVGGAPLKVKHLLESDLLAVRHTLFTHLSASNRQDMDPLKLSEKLYTHESLDVLDFYLSWIKDLLCIQAGSNADDITNTDFKTQLAAQAKRIDAYQLAKLMTFVMRQRKLACEGINLNKQLLLEDLFIRWVKHANLPG